MLTAINTSFKDYLFESPNYIGGVKEPSSFNLLVHFPYDCNWSHMGKPGASSRYPRWVARTQAVWSTSALFPCHKQGTGLGIKIGEARTRTWRLVSIQLPAYDLARQHRLADVLDPLHQCVRLEGGSGFLCAQPCICRHLGSDPVNGRSLSSFLSVNLPFK